MLINAIQYISTEIVSGFQFSMQPLPAASAASPLKASITKQIIAPCSSPPAMLIKADRGKPSSLQRLWYMMKKYNRRA